MEKKLTASDEGHGGRDECTLRVRHRQRCCNDAVEAVDGALEEEGHADVEQLGRNQQRHGPNDAPPHLHVFLSTYIERFIPQ